MPSHPVSARLRVVVFALLMIAADASCPAQSAPSTMIDWAAFLGRHDLRWPRLPTSWGESVFIGNGRIGATIDHRQDAFGWEINRMDVTHDESRYPIGRVTIKTSGRITGGTAQLSLWDAEASGVLTTDRGAVRWHSFVATTPSVIAILLEGSGGERAPSLEWTPALARPPAKVFKKEAFTPEELHPPAVVARSPAGWTSVQTFLGGDAHAESLVRLDAAPVADAGKSVEVSVISIGSGQTGGEALAEAQAATAAARTLGAEALRAGHQRWWHAYYPASFVTFPDGKLEAFYWIQVYKLGSAVRADGPALDLNGPWFRETPWPRYWWNLNIQLTYSPLFAANRLAPAESLFRALDTHFETLKRNVPEKARPGAAALGRSSGADMARGVNPEGESAASKEMGNLPWTLYYYWLSARYQHDDAILRRLYPILVASIGYYLAYVEKHADGSYHLPPSHSPELANVADATYDLALFRWGLDTLIATAARLQIDEPLLTHWREVLAHLTAFPTDETGLMIGRDLPLRESHRHYSHLLPIYPLALITPETPGGRALIEKSLQLWTSRTAKFRGYSFTGASAIHAMLGDGDAALHWMNRFIDLSLDDTGRQYLQANTLYAEAGPVIETPLSANTTVQEFFLQSWGGKLRVFPAVATRWREAAFDSLRGDGAFLVSAVRRDGRTAWVKVRSLAGEPCRIVVRDWTQAVVRHYDGSGGAPTVTVIGGGEFAFTLPKGASVVLAPTADGELPALAAVALPEAEQHVYPRLDFVSAKRANDAR